VDRALRFEARYWSGQLHGLGHSRLTDEAIHPLVFGFVFAVTALGLRGRFAPSRGGADLAGGNGIAKSLAGVLTTRLPSWR